MNFTEQERRLLEAALQTSRHINARSGFTLRKTAELRSQIEREQLRHYGRKILRRCMGL
jgi:hypothetical protein